MSRPTASKQAALNLFETHRKEFLEECRSIAQRIAQNNPNHTVTIDDVRARVQLPQDIDGRVFGAVFNPSEWEKVGYTQTTRASSHGRPIAIFRLKNPLTYTEKDTTTDFKQLSMC